MPGILSQHSAQMWIFDHRKDIGRKTTERHLPVMQESSTENLGF